MRANLLVAAAAAAVLSLLALPVSTAGSASEGATIVVSGDTVDIQINLDVVIEGILFHGHLVAGGDNAEIPEIQKAARDAVALWNKALAQYDAGCLKLHLDLTLNVIPWSKDRKLTEVTNGGITYPITSPGHDVAQWLTGSVNGRPTVYDPWAPGNPSVGDYTSPYIHDLPADWNDQLLQPANFAHELGHLMGLDDDYVSVPDGGDIPLPGRTGTLMADAGAIDQDLVDRLGAVAADADFRVPRCKVWEGPIHLDATLNAAGIHDQGTGDGTIRVVEKKHGKLSGTLIVARTKGCDQYPGKKDWRLRVRGSITRKKLVIEAVPGVIVTDAIGEPICGFPDGFIRDMGEPGSPVLPIVVKRTSEKTAGGEGDITDNEAKDSGIADAGVLSTHYTVTLERKSP